MAMTPGDYICHRGIGASLTIGKVYTVYEKEGFVLGLWFRQNNGYTVWLPHKEIPNYLTPITHTQLEDWL